MAELRCVVASLPVNYNVLYPLKVVRYLPQCKEESKQFSDLGRR